MLTEIIFTDLAMRDCTKVKRQTWSKSRVPVINVVCCVGRVEIQIDV